jgi:hypothetical protein
VSLGERRQEIGESTVERDIQRWGYWMPLDCGEGIESVAILEVDTGGAKATTQPYSHLQAELNLLLVIYGPSNEERNDGDGQHIRRDGSRNN